MGQGRPKKEPTFVKLGDVRAEILLDADGLFRVYRIGYKATPPTKIVRDHLEKAAAAAIALFFKKDNPEHPLLFVSQQHSEAYSITDVGFDQLVAELQELQAGGMDALELEIYALEKLQAKHAPASQVPPYKNNGLFSEHFLETRLKETEEWRLDAESARTQLDELYRNNQELLESANEAQTEEEFIKPTLKFLGFVYNVQSKTTGSGQPAWPDYALFASESAKRQAVTARDEVKLFSRALAIAEAKYWERDLDKARRNDKRETSASSVSPSFQIARYLEATGVEWGILTNGRQWRLYWGRAADKQKRFYEVDLLEALKDADQFKYFWLFFRKEAFQDGAKPSFLRRAIEESERYGLRVGKKLKNQVFEQAFPSLANGFLDFHRREIGAIDEGVLEQTYRASLTLLYRLLFLLYAEDRELLPVNEKLGYQKYSLAAIRVEVAEGMDRGERFSKQSFGLWERLETLFRIIDGGEPDLNVPPYNGGLFRPDRYPYLESHKVADAYLAEALDALARQEDEDGVRRFVDYKYLTVRELGAVYEGLLEYHLKQNGDAVHLENSEGERHLTGSYYTPDYIVQYIVEKVLAPLVEQRKEALRAVLDQYEEARRAQERSPSRSGAELLRKLQEEALDTLLDVKVVDPAMGSGHFLVAAVDYLSERFASVVAELDAEPITNALDDIRREIVGEMERYGLSLKEEQLSDINLLKRMVMKQSVFGVDLNEMAVELAKLSLWLDAFTVGAPLSFLDHHLRCGNSVVGMSKSEFLSWVDKETPLWRGEIERHIEEAALRAEALQKIRDLTPADIKRSQGLYDQAEKALRPLRNALDVYTAGLFAADKKHPLYTARHSLPTLELEELADPPERNHIADAVRFAREHRFFHWEFEFPEVFSPPAGSPRSYNPGFDAVIGNPPYVRQEQQSANKAFFKMAYPKVFSGTADLYVYFFARSYSILREGGRFGFISSRQFMKAAYGEGPRTLLSEHRLYEITDFGENRVFENAATFPAIFIAQNAPKEFPVSFSKVSRRDFERIEKAPPAEKVRVLREIASANRKEIEQASLEPKLWTLASREENEILRKMRAAGVPLGEYVDDINYGIKTGYNKAFFLDEATRNRLLADDPRSEELIKPLLVGDDVRHYHIRWPKRYLLTIPSSGDFEGPSASALESIVGIPRHPWADASSEEEALVIFKEVYPAVYEYLMQYEERLRKRQDKGKWWWELRSCTYYHLFENPKIVYPDIAKEPRFYLDTKGYYLSNTAYFFPVSDLYLLSILNSRFFFWAAKKVLGVLGEAAEKGRLRFFKVHLDELYVPRIHISNQAANKEVMEFRSHLNSQRFDLVEQWINKTMCASDKRTLAELAGHLASEAQRLTGEHYRLLTSWTSWVTQNIPTYDKLGKDWLKKDWPAELLEGGVEAILERFRARKVRVPPEVLSTLKTYTGEVMEQLRPLYQQINETERLIDTIVYKLYGLTEQEIAIVEGGA